MKLQDILEGEVLSMQDHKKKKSDKEADEVKDMLDRANKMTDMKMPKSAKIVIDAAWKKHQDWKKKNKVTK